MKVLCIGGGGAAGAETVGRLKARDEDYDIIIGCSTGAIMAPLVALASDSRSHDSAPYWDRLVKAYTNTGNSDVFKIYPFNRYGELDLLNVINQAVFKKSYSVGNTTPMLLLIQRWFTYEDYLVLQSSNVEILIAVLNVTMGRVEYKSSKDNYSYDEFTRYIAASGSPELIGSLWNFDGWEYSDSGLATLVPIEKAAQLPGVKEIHVFTHRMLTKEQRPKKPLMKKAFMQIVRALFRYVVIQRDHLEQKEILAGVLMCLVQGIKVRVTFLDSHFSKSNNMVMDKQLMTLMVKYGEVTATQPNINYEFTVDNWKDIFYHQSINNKH